MKVSRLEVQIICLAKGVTFTLILLNVNADSCALSSINKQNKCAQ